MPEQKIWGTDECIWKGNCVEVHLLKLTPKGGKPTCCSWHRHDYKHNFFRVLAGAIRVTFKRHWEPTGDSPTTVTLVSGRQFSLPPGDYHRFEVFEPATVIEVVWGTSLAKDIERADEGHILEDSASGT